MCVCVCLFVWNDKQKECERETESERGGTVRKDKRVTYDCCAALSLSLPYSPLKFKIRSPKKAKANFSLRWLAKFTWQSKRGRPRRWLRSCGRPTDQSLRKFSRSALARLMHSQAIHSLPSVAQNFSTFRLLSHKLFAAFSLAFVSPLPARSTRHTKKNTTTTNKLNCTHQ